MKFFLDTANLDEIRKGAEWGIVDGVTTNPTLIAKEGKPIKEQIAAICDIVDGPISAEVVATEAKEMIREGRELSKVHKNVIVKCPLIRDGIEACCVHWGQMGWGSSQIKRAVPGGRPAHTVPAYEHCDPIVPSGLPDQ